MPQQSGGVRNRIAAALTFADLPLINAQRYQKQKTLEEVATEIFQRVSQDLIIIDKTAVRIDSDEFRSVISIGSVMKALYHPAGQTDPDRALMRTQDYQCRRNQAIQDLTIAMGKRMIADSELLDRAIAKIDNEQFRLLGSVDHIEEEADLPVASDLRLGILKVCTDFAVDRV